MKLTIKKISYGFIALTFVFAVSCGGSSSSETEDHEHAEGMEHSEATDNNNEATEHSHDEGGNETEAHEHGDATAESVMGEAFTWMAMEESKDMLAYKTDNVMMMKHGEDNVMMFSPKGGKSSCMFNGKQGNVGVTATIKLDGNDGEVKLIHHSTDKDNYEFVALNGNMMNLGRVENGEEKILDSKEFELPTDWFTLTVTAAGSHFKGYINDKMITHGHADEMAAGYVGLSASGNSMLSVKKVEATPLEAEH
ncbi:MAG: hypothetical protein L3J29_10885 [Cyclobacteriaceae bacterium]|nr:hypothetical protein [Cyclobacteriaceae bacterium]